MREELKRYNTIGDTRGILHFANTVLKGNEIKKDSARQICSFVNDIRINFNGAVSFFEYLGFITISASQSLNPTEEGKKLYALIGTDSFERMLCEGCIQKITSDDVIDIDAVKFDIVKGKYYVLKHGFPISAAVFRNVLIQFHVLSERSDGTLELCEQYESLFAELKKSTRKKMSIEALKKQLEKQEIQGEVAELYVINFEMNRLGNLTTLSDKIKRISAIDVSAGYDIVSFGDASSVEYDRFIEVKSYIGNPHFYWSKNEIDVATLYDDKYYLYLVDAEKVDRSDYTPLIIRNPAKHVIQSDGWIMQPTSYLVLPTGADF
jgi:hypothetical protein